MISPDDIDDLLKNLKVERSDTPQLREKAKIVLSHMKDGTFSVENRKAFEIFIRGELVIPFIYNKVKKTIDEFEKKGGQIC